MSRPIWSSVWLKKPAKTSCVRAKRRCSSGGKASHSCTQGGRSVHCVPPGYNAELQLTSERRLAPALPAAVELSLVAIDPLGGSLVGGMLGTRRKVHEERLVGRRMLLIGELADRRVGEVLAEVIALLGTLRRIDEVVVGDQVRGPLVGVGVQESVEAFESLSQGPVAERTGSRSIPTGREMPFSESHGGIAGISKMPGHGRRRRRQFPGVTGKPHGDVRHESHTDRVMVATGEKRGSSRRAQGGDVKLVVAQSTAGQTVDVGRGHVRSETPQLAEPDVVEQDHDNVRTVGKSRC